MSDSRKRSPKCPVHLIVMVQRDSQWGPKAECPESGCDMVAWTDKKGKWSKPADKETRRLRHRCHNLFDQLWKHGIMRRKAAYAWLAGEMGITTDRCHFSLFGKEECRQAIEILQGHLAIGRR